MLRQRAEAFLQKTGQDIVDMPVQEVQKLVHELQVYQIRAGEAERGAAPHPAGARNVARPV